MSHKVNPISFRLGHTTTWKSRWFDLKNFPQFLKEDIDIRNLVENKFKNAGIKNIEIERSRNVINIFINAARTGLIIGRGGEGINKLKNEIEKYLRKISADKKLKYELKLTVEEVKNPEIHAAIVAQNIADQIEKRIPFKRAVKQAIDKTAANKTVKGVKVIVSGRLGGSEIARTEKFKEGRIPLQTLRADIDFSYKIALTVYGIIGIRVWIYRGDIFEKTI